VTNRGWARFFARGIVGILFFMAGWWKCFELTPVGHTQRFFLEAYADTWIPVSLLWATGLSIPVVELVAALAELPALAWVTDVADRLLAALEASHARGIVHRDLKPDNVFLPGAEPRRAKLMDFGLVVAAETAPDARLTRAEERVGTPRYMAPEQFVGDDVDARTDLYAFGCILYELLTLRPPFVGDLTTIERGHVRLRPRRPSELAAVPDALEGLVLSCLAKEKARRPADAGALRL